MAGRPRIELHELEFKYQRHPQLVDIYVEGEFDRDVLNQLFREQGLSAVVGTFTVAEVNVPNEFLTERQLRLGSHKQRLIGVAAVLEKALLGVPSNVTCLVDADQDRALGSERTTPHLAYTTHTCLEMHCLSSEALHKFLVLGCNLGTEQVPEFLAVAESILPVQFCLRALNEALELAAVTPHFSRGLTERNELSTFSGEKYLTAFVASNELHHRGEQIHAEFIRLTSTLPGDLRDKAHGHDFVNLLFEFVANKARLRLQKNSDIAQYGGRLLMTAVDCGRLSADPVFGSLITAARGGAFVW